MGEEEEKVVPKSRKSRRQCYASDDPTHVCSPNHVRVPAHCRIKRFKRKGGKEAPSKLLENAGHFETKPIPVPQAAAGRDIARNIL
jgi:hypothetical protein